MKGQRHSADSLLVPRGLWGGYENREVISGILYGRSSNLPKLHNLIKILDLITLITSSIGRKLAMPLGGVVCPFESV